MMRILLNFSRLLAGAVFVFSGFVKGVDPLGTAYKLEDYFVAYGMTWANELSLILSILLCTIEFVIGAALLFNLKMRITSWALLLMMSFFTLLTFYDALYAPVPDCGCFGDAIKLTNWETFYKNIVLMVFTLIVYKNRKRFTACMGGALQKLAIIIFFAGFAFFSFYNYTHLPMIDFRHWKIGNKMTADVNAEVKVFVKYKNLKSGEVKEYLSPNFPWNDPDWLAEWEFVDQRTETEGETIAHNLMAEDVFQNDFTDYILESPGIFVVVAHDLTNASAKGLERISELLPQISESGYPVALLTASLPEDAEIILDNHDMQTELFFADEVVLKTMIRSNPGLVLFYNGYVAGKWHFNRLPEQAEIDRLTAQLHQLYP